VGFKSLSLAIVASERRPSDEEWRRSWQKRNNAPGKNEGLEWIVGSQKILSIKGLSGEVDERGDPEKTEENLDEQDRVNKTGSGNRKKVFVFSHLPNIGIKWSGLRGSAKSLPFTAGDTSGAFLIGFRVRLAMSQFRCPRLRGGRVRSRMLDLRAKN
jgi:hypothetical protein